MNLKICCEANVDLENYSKLENINYEVKDYSISGDSLNGSVDINGVFINTNNEKSNFGKNVPFTVMFHSDVHNNDSYNSKLYNNNYYIEKIYLDNMSNYEIVNNGIVCSFDLVIDYSLKSENKEHKEDHLISEENNPNEDSAINDFNENVSYKQEVEEINDEDLEDAIKMKYNKLLDDIFSSREESVVNNNDNNLLENEKLDNVEEISLDNQDEETKINNVNINNSYNLNNKFNFLKFLDVKTTLRVYYPEKESDIESICKEENVNVLDVYSETYNKDFTEKKRIIIEK